MSRVDFAHGARHRLRMACRTTARHVQAGHRMAVWCTDARRLQRYDTLLWSFDPVSFIPHVHAQDPLVDHAPVVLVDQPADLRALSACGWLLNLDLACPPHAARFARILEIVSEHPDDRAAARQRWQQYRKQGLELHSHALPTGAD
ncbi:DNA polymerase III subunit chi [Castellaniella sp.]|uniref:DNA polymerase III subunit chi n=1 Tax=Castellaniella sp. TaxID=1955812 RepID=UPI00355F3803